MKEKKDVFPRYTIPKTLSQSIYNYLKKSIVDGHFKVKQRINENEIAEVFQVSRTPVREAVTQLAAEGLVEIDPHHGVLVKDVSLKEIKDILEVISSLESLAIDLAVDHIDEEELKRLEKMNSKLEHYYQQKDIEKYMNLNFEFHKRIWNHAYNNFLLHCLQTCLLTQIKRYRSIFKHGYEKTEILEKSMREHKKILEALKSKDKKKLKTLAIEHWTPALSWSKIEKEFF